MAVVREEKIDSLPSYLALIEKARLSQLLWYRGCGSCAYPLLPSLYRHQKRKTPEALAELEGQLMTRFRQRSIPYHSRSLTDDWDTLFFMQHYGVPTRLLDWTENPFIGLHFALMGANRTPRRRLFTSDAAVWVLDPVAWNQYSLSVSLLNFDGGVLSPGDEAMRRYRPAPKFAGMPNLPAALYGTHNSTRIVAQQGVFTIFGREKKPMEQVFDVEGFPDECLTKIILDKSLILQLRKSLLSHGITESLVFPDLEGLAREIKRVFGFED
jgi:hypothetical protein